MTTDRKDRWEERNNRCQVFGKNVILHYSFVIEILTVFSSGVSGTAKQVGALAPQSTSPPLEKCSVVPVCNNEKRYEKQIYAAPVTENHLV